jgi:hypothetical protein
VKVTRDVALLAIGVVFGMTMARPRFRRSRMGRRRRRATAAALLQQFLTLYRNPAEQ